MKGLSLPINMIVIIAVAVLVLVVLSAFFSGQFGSGVETIDLERAFQDGCQALRFKENCRPSATVTIDTGYDIPGSSKGTDSLLDVCEARNPATFKDLGALEKQDACARLCGCSV